MNTRISYHAVSMLAVAVFFTSAVAASYGQARSINGNGFDNSDINANANEAVRETKKIVKTIEYVAVSPEREWTSADENQPAITGSLLAFAREKETGKVSIIENKQVRLLVGKKDFILPLGKLSMEDQAYIHELVESARAAGKLLEAASAGE